MQVVIGIWIGMILSFAVLMVVISHVAREMHREEDKKKKTRLMTGGTIDIVLPGGEEIHYDESLVLTCDDIISVSTAEDSEVCIQIKGHKA